MRTLSLFSGLGGLDIGAETAGAEIIFGSDRLSEAEEVFAGRFPDARFVRGDVRALKAFPPADLVLAGYPCQSFSMGGARAPHADPRTSLYTEFARCLDAVQPRFFVAENVPGLRGLDARKWLWYQHDRFQMAGRHGYNVTVGLLRAEQFGLPQRRRRVFFIGVRRDCNRWYHLPASTHGPLSSRLLPYIGHGDALRGLDLWPEGEYYSRPEEDEGRWPWYFVSRNRKARWDAPSYTVLANGRHVTLHPASPTMELDWSDLDDRWRQHWRFTNRYEHLERDETRPTLPRPRRLSWRECARLQSLPDDLPIPGPLMRKYELVGNAVPPLLAEAVLRPLIDGSGLHRRAPEGLGEIFKPSVAWPSPEKFDRAASSRRPDSPRAPARTPPSPPSHAKS